MPATKEAPVRSGLPAELEELIHTSIERMDEKQLRHFTKESDKIMKESKRRLGARRARRRKA
jgi:hypothetical protein